MPVRFQFRPLAATVVLALVGVAVGGLHTGVLAQGIGLPTTGNTQTAGGFSVNAFGTLVQPGNANIVPVPTSAATPPIYLGPTQPGGTYTGPLSAGVYLSAPASSTIVPGSQLPSTGGLVSGTGGTGFQGATATGGSAATINPLGTTQSGTTTPGSTSASRTAGTSATTTTSTGTGTAP